MEMQNQNQDQDKAWREMENIHRRGKIMGGLLIVTIGSLFLAKELGAEIPSWLFSWKMLLIALGVVTAVKHKFMHPGWIILMGVGGIFLMSDVYPDLQIRPFLWPVLIIMLGLFIIFKPRRKHKHFARQYWQKWHEHDRQNYRACNTPNHPYFDTREDMSSEDYIDSTACFAGIKKNILSKKFKGGNVTNIFGGSELNLMQADIEEKANLEITQVFGGTKLLVPANWEIKSEIVTILGSVEDKRPMSQGVGTEPAKILVLVGTTVFGGIEIRSL